MMKKKLLVTIIAFLSVFQAFAQTADRRLGIELNGGINEYQGDLGSALFFARKPNYQGIGGSVSYYLSPSFDLTFFGSGGDVGFYTDLPYVDPEFTTVFFRANIATLNGGIRYKILKDKPFTPYLMLGLGGAYIHSKSNKHPNALTDGAGNAAAGFGFQFNLNEKLSLRVQSMYNYTFNDIWDGEPYTYMTHTRNKNNDLIAFHSVGFVYNMQYGSSSMSGGPSQKDKDKDGVPDALDKCPKTQPWQLPVNDEGCPKDSDLDSIPDYQDSCPSQFGLRKFNGCPDSDGDGIEDRKDKCPGVAGTKDGEGCPDSDGDGIYDNADVCPNVAGIAANKGCPEIKKEDVKKINVAARGINFETKEAKITPDSYKNLDELVKLLNQYPEANVQIDGHTDNVGDPAKNMALSQSRCDAVVAYLINKGVAAGRMKAVGHGDTQPIADNSTDKGRKENRRVDFRLYY